MSEAPMPSIQVVESATHLEIELLRRPTREVEFTSPSQEATYERRDYRLACQIEEVVCAGNHGASLAQLMCTNEDWSPNESRGLTLNAPALSLEVLTGLTSLLVEEYANWRIHVHVQESLGGAESNEVGSMCIFTDLAIVEERVHERLRRVT